MKTQSNDTDEMSRALIKLTEELENTRAQLRSEIDRRIKAQEDFERTNKRNQLILDSAGDGFWDWDISTDHVFFSPQWFRSLGYEPGELEPHVTSWRKLVHPDDMPKVREALNAHFEGKTSIYEVENRLLTKSGNWRWNLDRGRVVSRDNNGKPIRMVGTDTDITQRKELEKTRLESEKQLNGILNHSPNVIYLKDLEGRYIRVNRQCETLFNMSNDWIKGKTDLEIFPKEMAEAFMINDQKVLKSGRPLEIEEVAPHSDGPHTYISIKFPLRNSSGAIYGICGISTDITERKRAEEELKKSQEQLMHSEKLSAIGKLSASIAHEFNNPIFGIRNVLEIVAEEVSMDEKHKGFIDLAVRECNRLKDLILKLQEFHRPSPAKLDLIDIHETIDDMLILIKKKLKEKNIVLRKYYSDRVPKINIVSDQIKQVVLNLLQNAEESVRKEGGRISIATGIDASSVTIKIEDNGCGIPPENLKKIFDPFFTTKPAVKGIGLGLSVSYGIIKAHAGNIEVQSIKDKGSRFLVTLPMVENSA